MRGWMPLATALQDGGCAVSAAAGQAGLLTHLLLLLQHKQLHRKSSRWSDNMLLLLQPLSCDPLPESTTTPGVPAAASAAAAGLVDGSSAQAVSAGQHSSRSAAAHSGAWPRHSTSACPVDELRFFATFLPLHTLLSVERSSAAEAVAAGAGAAVQQVPAPGLLGPAAAAGREAAATAASWQNWSPADSSCDELAAAANGSSSHTNGSVRHGHHTKSISELLKAASGSASAALLCDAVQRGALRSMNVGLHTDVASTAASVVAAVRAGQVLALHVKHGDAAHALAYSALDMACRLLHGAAGQQGFGALLVQGQNHEHVHARTHGHAHGMLSSPGAAALDGQYTAGAAVAGAAGERGATDASMDVGGFGAAFYGLGGWGDDRGTQQHQGVLHKYGQEVWLCVVPLGVAA